MHESVSMATHETTTVGDAGQRTGISRRGFLQFCAAAATLLALPPTAYPLFAARLAVARRRPLVWLSFQECTGCTESLLRAQAPGFEDLVFEMLSLDYHHTLQAAAGEAAEAARRETQERHFGDYLLVVDGSIPAAGHGYSTIAGRDNLELLAESAAGAGVVFAVGSCAAFGGLPAASPNPTAARSVVELMAAGEVPRRSLVNLPGCPPLPLAIAGTLAHYLAFDQLPRLDDLGRPLGIYGNTVHERCSRYHFYQEGKFAGTFDDAGARQGWCLYRLGCKGPVTHNACAVHKWNQGASFPIESGHPCIGCSEPGFWEQPLYRDLEWLAAHGRVALPDMVARPDTGEALYQENCVYCHSADPRRLRTPADEVAELLRQGDVRAHRQFQFSDAELRALGDYLRQQRGE